MKNKLIKKINSITKDKTRNSPGDFAKGYRIALKEIRKELVKYIRKNL